MTVTAMFTETNVKQYATVTLEATIKEQTDDICIAEFMVTRSVPGTYAFVSSGLLLTQNNDFADEANLSLEGHTDRKNDEDIILFRTIRTENDGQYKLTAKTSSDKTFYARGFVVYLDITSGKFVTIYTDIISVNE